MEGDGEDAGVGGGLRIALRVGEAETVGAGLGAQIDDVRLGVGDALNGAAGEFAIVEGDGDGLLDVRTLKLEFELGAEAGRNGERQLGERRESPTQDGEHDERERTFGMAEAGDVIETFEAGFDAATVRIGRNGETFVGREEFGVPLMAGVEVGRR